MIAAAELAKTVSSALESAKAAEGGDVAEQGRCLDILRVLQKAQVSAPLLKETEAGKKVNRLTKSSSSKIAAAAAQVVQTWKECVKKEAGAGSLSSQPSFGTAASSGAAEIATAAAAAAADARQQQDAAASRPAAGAVSRPAAGAGGSSKAAAPAAGPKRPPPKTGDPQRDKIRQLLCDGLALVKPEERAGQDPGEAAAEVEAAIHARFGSAGAAEYKAKVRSLSYNFKDAKNPDLRRRVLVGDIDPQQLLEMSAEELASDEKRRENTKIRQEAAAEAVRGQTQQASTDMFKCSRCKQNKCTYYQMQTRSADEPMTTFVSCVNCNNKWKFC